MNGMLFPWVPRRSQHRCIWAASIGLLLLVTCLFLLWQIEIGEERTVAGNAMCQLVDIGEGKFPRGMYESIRGNRKLYLSDGAVFFVSESDFNRCWSMTPWEMRENGYVPHVVLVYRKLPFGGRSVARLLSCEYVTGKVTIRKGSTVIP
jgi:hypothetical protein